MKNDLNELLNEAIIGAISKKTIPTNEPSIDDDYDMGIGDSFSADNDFGGMDDGMDDGIEDDVMQSDPIAPVEAIGDDVEDEQTEMLTTSLNRIQKRANAIVELLGSRELEPWMIAKIIKSETYISSVWEDLDDDADFANDVSDDTYF